MGLRSICSCSGESGKCRFVIQRLAQNFEAWPYASVQHLTAVYQRSRLSIESACLFQLIATLLEPRNWWLRSQVARVCDAYGWRWLRSLGKRGLRLIVAILIGAGGA